MSKLSLIEGIGEGYALKFKEAGITTVEGLLEAGSVQKGRDDLAAKLDISEKRILKWVNHADLFRVKGIDEEYVELLEAAGIDTVIELGQRKPAQLAAKLLEVNNAKKLVREVPSLKQAEEWVAQADKLPRKVFY